MRAVVSHCTRESLCESRHQRAGAELFKLSVAAPRNSRWAKVALLCKAGGVLTVEKWSYCISSWLFSQHCCLVYLYLVKKRLYCSLTRRAVVVLQQGKTCSPCWCLLTDRRATVAAIVMRTLSCHFTWAVAHSSHWTTSLWVWNTLRDIRYDI